MIFWVYRVFHKTTRNISWDVGHWLNLYSKYSPTENVWRNFIMLRKHADSCSIDSTASLKFFRIKIYAIFVGWRLSLLDGRKYKHLQLQLRWMRSILSISIELRKRPAPNPVTDKRQLEVLKYFLFAEAQSKNNWMTQNVWGTNIIHERVRNKFQAAYCATVKNQSGSNTSNGELDYSKVRTHKSANLAFICKSYK